MFDAHNNPILTAIFMPGKGLASTLQAKASAAELEYPKTLPTDEKEGKKEVRSRMNDGMTMTYCSISFLFSPKYQRTRAHIAFNEICDRLTSEILAELGSKYEMTTEALDWIRKMIEYNVKGGKLNRGLTVCICMLVCHK